MNSPLLNHSSEQQIAQLHTRLQKAENHIGALEKEMAFIKDALLKKGLLPRPLQRGQILKTKR